MAKKQTKAPTVQPLTYAIECSDGHRFKAIGWAEGPVVSTIFGTFRDGLNVITGAKIIDQGTQSDIETRHPTKKI